MSDPRTPAGLVARRDRALLAVLSLVLLLPGTLGVSLIDRDEGWYAQVSREMLESGDWLVPRYLGEPWLAKPPLLYWCVAAAYSIFGISAWAGRLVSVLAMVGVVQLLATLAAELYDRRTALIAAVSFVTAGLPLLVGKLLLTDALLLFWVLAAVLALSHIATRGPSLTRCLGFWLAVGLAILAKGPAVVLFVGAFALGLLVRADRRRMTLGGRFWLSSLLGFAVAAPWYAYIALHAGRTLSQQLLWFEIVARLVGTPHGQGGPPGYHAVVGLAGWLPWTVLVPGAVIAAWRSRRSDPAARRLLLWWGVPWVVLELVPSKLPHYVLPCYVPLAIMLGRLCAHGLRGGLANFERVMLGAWAVGLTGLGALAVAVAAVWHVHAWAPAAAGLGAVLVLGFGVVTRLVSAGRLPAAWRAAVGTIGLFHVLLGSWVLPRLEPERLSRCVAERANALAGADMPVWVCGYTEPSVFFYLQPPGRIIAPAEIPTLFAAPRPSGVLIAREGDLRQVGLLPEADRPGWRRLRGLNYVKGRMEIVYVGHVDGRDGAAVPPPER